MVKSRIVNPPMRVRFSSVQPMLIADFNGKRFIDHGNEVPYEERYECEGHKGPTIDEVVSKILRKRCMIWVYDLAGQLSSQQ